MLGRTQSRKVGTAMKKPGTAGKKGKTTIGGLLAVVLVIAAMVFRGFVPNDGGGGIQAGVADASPTPATTVERRGGTAESNAASGAREIRRLYERKQSDAIVEGRAEVIRLLPDDNEGSRHQKFIIRIDRGLTVLISHNIDLAPRVPLRAGETIGFKGEYEWTDKGGVIHWTHHDPKQWREGGWIEHDGRRYE